MAQTVITRDRDTRTVVVRERSRVETVTTERAPVDVLMRGRQGPPGPQGPAGAPGGTTVDYIAGETIHGRRAVMVEDGVVFHPDTSVVGDATKVIGIATNAAALGDTVTVQTIGTFSEGTWTWAPVLVYCGNGGVLTQSPAATGWLLSIGRATNQTDIAVDIDTPFMRA